MVDSQPPSLDPAAVSEPLRRPPWWLRAPALSLLVTLLLLAGALAWPLWHGRTAEGSALPTTGLPWQVQTDGQGGSQVFGLALGQGATLGTVQSRWPEELVVALIAPPGQPAALEAYVDGFNAGFVNGKLVLALGADAGWVARAQARSTKRDIGEGAVRRWALVPDDLAQALQFPVTALAFIPSARLDETVVQQRFGPAAERLSSADGALHLLYPATGVAVALPPASGDGARAKAVIQYVPPRDFEARLGQPLRQPLRMPSGASTAASLAASTALSASPSVSPSLPLSLPESAAASALASGSGLDSAAAARAAAPPASAP